MTTTLLARHWHHLPEEEVTELLETDASTGLDTFSVERRREQFGPNAVTVKRGDGALRRFLLQFHQPLIYILMAAALIKALLGDWVDAGVIFGVVLVNATIGFIQEEKATAAIAALADTLVSDATVIRAGQRVVISTRDVVPGDLVVLSAGDKVPADIRLLAAREMDVDESALTGESVPVEKVAPLVNENATVLAERTNMVYASTLVTRGEGTGIVIATGDDTEVGRISTLLGNVETLDTPLTQKMARFSTVILWAILGLSLVTFVVGMIRGESAGNMFSAVVALAVGAIPEGLPAAVTITLAIGVSRMARRRAIIRKLPAVETLGSTTVICSDKTGTLTANQMTTQIVVAGGLTYDVSGVGYGLEGDLLLRTSHHDPGDAADSPLELCLATGALCNDGDLVPDGSGWSPSGDPTDVALVVAAAKGGIDVRALRMRWERLDAVPFDSRHRYMATLNRDVDTRTLVLHAKGAAEPILARCVTMTDHAGGLVPIDSEAITGSVEEIASNGYRVMAMAIKSMDETRTSIEHGGVSDRRDQRQDDHG